MNIIQSKKIRIAFFWILSFIVLLFLYVFFTDNNDFISFQKVEIISERTLISKIPTLIKCPISINPNFQLNELWIEFQKPLIVDDFLLMGNDKKSSTLIEEGKWFGLNIKVVLEDGQIIEIKSYGLNPKKKGRKSYISEVRFFVEKQYAFKNKTISHLLLSSWNKIEIKKMFWISSNLPKEI